MSAHLLKANFAWLMFKRGHGYEEKSDKKRDKKTGVINPFTTDDRIYHSDFICNHNGSGIVFHVIERLAGEL